MTEERSVIWKCLKCSAFHNWAWSKWDVFPGEITMTCDKCGAETKMIMDVDKNGNGLAMPLPGYTELEEKIQRAVNKVMKSKKTELEPNQIIKDGNCIYFRGEKYQRVETPQSFYDKLWGLLKTKLGDTTDCDEMSDRVMDLIRENIPEPKKGPGLPEYFLGYNEAIRQINERF